MIKEPRPPSLKPAYGPVRTVLRRLMAAESMYYESLVSARYVGEAKKGNRTRRLQEAKTPYLLCNVWLGGDIVI